VVGIQLMRPGDEWVFYVPPQMAYGFKDTGPIPAGSVLVFRVQLIDIKPPKDAPAG
jgi:peptidylprolyl isomerase/FKBP-type peptidyl-prolyl cis-trans isomerase FklB